MKVPHNKEVANHVVPESCAGHREVHGEALTGVRAGQPLSRVRNSIRVPTPSDLRKATRTGAPSQAPVRPGVVEDPGMHAHSLGDLQSDRQCQLWLAARIGKVRCRRR